MDTRVSKFTQPISLNEEEIKKYEHGISAHAIKFYFLKGWNIADKSICQDNIGIEICKWFYNNKVANKVEIIWVRFGKQGINAEISLDDRPSQLYHFKNISTFKETKVSASLSAPRRNTVIFKPAERTLDLTPLVIATHKMLQADPGNSYASRQCEKILAMANKGFCEYAEYVLLHTLTAFEDLCSITEEGMDATNMLFDEIKKIKAHIHATLKNENPDEKSFQAFKITNSTPPASLEEILKGGHRI